MKKKHWRSSEGQKREAAFRNHLDGMPNCTEGVHQPQRRFLAFWPGIPFHWHSTEQNTLKGFFSLWRGCDWRSSSHIGHSFLIDARAAWPYRWKNGGRWEKNEQEFMIGSSPKTGNECFAAGRTCFSVVVDGAFFPSFLVLHCDAFLGYGRSIVFTQVHCPKPLLFHPESFTNGQVRVGNKKNQPAGEKKNLLGKEAKKIPTLGPVPCGATGPALGRRPHWALIANWIELNFSKLNIMVNHWI